MSDQRQEWFALLEEIYAETAHPQGELRICTECEDAPCEVGPEQVTLLPHEDEFIQRRLMQHGQIVSLETVHGIAGCRQCPFFQNHRCAIHAHRPLDCRTYPMVPRFDSVEPRYAVSGVCPRRAGMDRPFKQLMAAIWRRLAPHLSDEWKAAYDRRQPSEFLEPLVQIESTAS